AVYYTSDNTGWKSIGGTGAGAPQWAGLIAVVDGGRASQGLAPLDGARELLPKLYGMPWAFHDISPGQSVVQDSQGFNVSTTSAKAGYDLVTGLGTPRADVLFNNLALPVPAVAGRRHALDHRRPGQLAQRHG